MSRPRKPFGSHQPGRLPSTMMKVLAAEMSDPARLRRGKLYAKDGSVLDIIIEPGLVTCEVQGSRATPYIASLEVTQGDGMPLRRDVHPVCTCPDDDNWDDHACKHVLATMFAFADELLIEPELLDVWRGREGEHDVGVPRDAVDEHADGTPPSDVDLVDDVDDNDSGRGPSGRHLRLVRDDGTDGRDDDRRRARSRSGDDLMEIPLVDPLDELLRFADGAELPAIPEIGRLKPTLPRRPELAAVLRDVTANLRLDWD